MNAAASLQDVRRRRGWSLRELAARAGTSHSTLQAYEAGRKVPSVATFDRIVRAAGFVVGAEVTPAVGGTDPADRGSELVEALELAGRFPARHADTLEYPRFGGGVTGIPDKMLAISRSLDDAGIGHAFGGALALAWCTERARGTIDIDLNVFASTDRAGDVLAALPPGIARSSADLDRLVRDGQHRLWWDATPVDLFLNTTAFHDQLGGRARQEEFAGTSLPFLSCADLAVFKAFFDRTRDWADLEEMAAAGTLDRDRVVGVLANHLGPGDERIRRLQALT